MVSEIPEYMRRVMLAFERNPEIFSDGEGSLFHHYIQHDDWCSLLVRSDACDCKPDVYVEVKGNRYSVNPDGSIALATKP